MILSQKQIEEIAAAVTEDFNKFFFGTESEEVHMLVPRRLISSQEIISACKCLLPDFPLMGVFAA